MLASFLFGISASFTIILQQRRQLLRRLYRASLSPLIFNEESAKSCILKLEARVQRDEGCRGITELLLPPGELFNAAQAAFQSNRVAIISGFPCLMQYNPPTETDGPLGCMAIARALLALGKNVTILTDECNEEVFLACASASQLGAYQVNSQLSFESFPASNKFDESDWMRLNSIGIEVDLVVAIERAGPAYDGSYYTMRGLDMTHLLAPLDSIMHLPIDRDDGLNPNEYSSTSRSKRSISIGIGDGGNEVGMGKIYSTVISSRVPNAPLIACVVPADHLLVSSVSNWGGYALAAAIAVYSSYHFQLPIQSLLEGDASCTGNHYSGQAMLPTIAQESDMCLRMVESGARDGMSGKQECMVDGMPLSVSLDVLNDLSEICLFHSHSLALA